MSNGRKQKSNGHHTKAFSLEQLQLLRLARSLVKQEFDVTLAVADADVLTQLKRYAMQSEEETLFNLYRSVLQPDSIGASATCQLAAKVKTQSLLLTTAPRQSRVYRGAQV